MSFPDALKPFACEECGARFSREANRASHIRGHIRRSQLISAHDVIATTQFPFVMERPIYKHKDAQEQTREEWCRQSTKLVKLLDRQQALKKAQAPAQGNAQAHQKNTNEGLSTVASGSKLGQSNQQQTAEQQQHEQMEQVKDFCYQHLRQAPRSTSVSIIQSLSSDRHTLEPKYTLTIPSHQLTFMCSADGCKQKFQTKDDREKHIRCHTHTPHLYHCPRRQCRRTFLKKSRLAEHFKTHVRIESQSHYQPDPKTPNPSDIRRFSGLTAYDKSRRREVLNDVVEFTGLSAYKCIGQRVQHTV